MKMNDSSIKQHVQETKVLKDMKKYLGNPQTVKALYDALKLLPSEEFYDLHEDELGEVRHMYHELDKIPDDNFDRGRIHHEISRMFRLREDIEKIGASLCYAGKEYPVEKYFSKNEEEEYAIFSRKIKTVFLNVIEHFEKYKKQISIQGAYELEEHTMRRIHMLKQIKGDEVARIITYLLRNHIYTGGDPVDKALHHLMEINGEDVDRPLLGGNSINEDYKWDSLLFMQYGFGQIGIDELYDGLQKIIKRNNEDIQSSLEPFIPLYTWLRSILQKTHDEEQKDEQLVPIDISEEITEIKDEIDVKSIAQKSHENDCLKLLLKTDKADLEKRLQPLKNICDIRSADVNVLEQ